MIALNLRNIVSIVGDFINSVTIGLGLVKDWSEVAYIMDCIAYPMAVHVTFVKPYLVVNVGLPKPGTVQL